METAVKIEKDIENLSSLIKFDQFINLGYFYHVCCCQKDKFDSCFLHVIYSICKLKSKLIKLVQFKNFKIFVDRERERLKLDRKFQEILKNMECSCHYLMTKDEF